MDQNEKKRQVLEHLNEARVEAEQALSGIGQNLESFDPQGAYSDLRTLIEADAPVHTVYARVGRLALDSARIADTDVTPSELVASMLHQAACVGVYGDVELAEFSERIAEALAMFIEGIKSREASQSEQS